MEPAHVFALLALCLTILGIAVTIFIFVIRMINKTAREVSICKDAIAQEMKADRDSFNKDLSKLRDSFDSKLKRQDERFFGLLEAFTKKAVPVQHCSDVQNLFDSKLRSAMELKDTELKHLADAVKTQAEAIEGQSLVVGNLNDCVHKLDKKFDKYLDAQGAK